MSFQNCRQGFLQYPIGYHGCFLALSSLTSFHHPFVNLRPKEPKQFAASVKRDCSAVNPFVHSTFRRMPWEIFAEFSDVHPRRKTAIGRVCLYQGT
jgi:hypothetical protein